MIKGKDDNGGIDAFLGKNTTFKGTLIFDGLVRIDGNFEGNIKTNDTLVVANSGNVKAEVEAGLVKISGKFDGTVSAKTKVELYKPAVVTGTIRAAAVQMEEGVVFNGSLEMGESLKTATLKKGEV